MRQRILGEIKQLEERFDVQVCLAVESGSRAWGYPSKKSDYDVRFIYVHRKEWYLSIDERKDIIELPVDNGLDMNGWDLKKALRLFRKSNPPLMEWLHSSIVYYENYSLAKKMKAIQNQVLIPQAAFHHYLNMAKRNFHDFHTNDPVKVKKYLNILRPILACIWMEKNHSFPPNSFHVLVNELIDNCTLKQEIELLVKRKMNGEELAGEPKITTIINFIEKEIERLREAAKTLESNSQDVTPLLDDLFRAIIEEAWKDSTTLMI